MAWLDRNKRSNGSTSWRVRWRKNDDSTDNFKVGVAPKRIASQRLAQVTTLLAMGKDPNAELKNIRTNDLTISQASDIDHDWRKVRVQPRTVEIDNFVINLFTKHIGDIPLQSMSFDVVNGFLNDLLKSERYTNTTINMYFRTLRSWLQRMTSEHNLIKSNPTMGIKLLQNKSRSQTGIETGISFL